MSGQPRSQGFFSLDTFKSKKRRERPILSVLSFRFERQERRSPGNEVDEWLKFCIFYIVWQPYCLAKLR